MTTSFDETLTARDAAGKFATQPRSDNGPDVLEQDVRADYDQPEFARCGFSADERWNGPTQVLTRAMHLTGRKVSTLQPR